MLRHQSYLIPEVIFSKCGNIHPIDSDLPLVDIIKSRDETGKSRFASTTGTNQGNCLASINRNIHITKCHMLIVGETDILHANLPYNTVYFLNMITIFDLIGRIQDFLQTIQ